MNNCLYCNASIPDKTAKGTKRTFCNKSCSRKHYVENNKEALVESGKKSFQTLSLNNPDAIKSRGRSTPNKKAAAAKMRELGHYSNMGKAGSASAKEKGVLFGGVDHTREKMIQSGKWIDYSKFDFSESKRYMRAVRKLTRELYGSAGEGYHWDHIVPISTGFKMQIAPSIMCSAENIRKLPSKENLSKGSTVTEDAQNLLKTWNIN